jgi:hypothetical protein
MVPIHPHFITDADGNKISVILPLKEFEALLEELDEMEDIRLFDEAMKEDDGERILFSDYVREREKRKE